MKMPTRIEITLPAQAADDTISVLSEDTENRAPSPLLSSREPQTPRASSPLQSSVGPNTVVRSTQTDPQPNKERTDLLDNAQLSSARKVNGNKREQKDTSVPVRPLGVPRASSAPVARRTLHMTRVSGVVGGGEERRLVKQHQHEMDDGQSRPVVLARQHVRPASAAVRSTRAAQREVKSCENGGTTNIAFSSTYDIDLEYRDIMVKALHAYSHHRHTEKHTAGSLRRTRSDVVIKHSDNVQRQRGSVTSNGHGADDTKGHPNTISSNLPDSYVEVLSRSLSENTVDNLVDDVFHEALCDPASTDSPKVFKLSQCSLKYNEDQEEEEDTREKPLRMKKRRRTMSARSPTRTSTNSRVSVSLYPPPPSDGVLADSIGRVYKTVMKPPQQSNSRKQRPWSALPYKFTDHLKQHTKVIAVDEHERLPSDQNDRVTSDPGDHTQAPPTFPHHRLHVQTLRLGASAKMSGGQPISHSTAYQRRNQTTHSWYDTGHMMSQSLPSSSFLHRQYLGGGSSVGSSPRSSRDATAMDSPSAGKSNSLPRPSSSYSYDGGFFVGAHTGQAEYFVIHPDWVSESMTIKKLSINNKGPPKVMAKPTTRQKWSGRRCLSAPPSKLRNPITWDQSASEPVNIPVPGRKK